jgi:aminopeptidase N
MSSYLNAFVISDLEFITNEGTKAENEPLHRVWTRPDSLKKAQYALDNSIAALKALEEYTGFTYALEKVDSAGIPGKTGAMENW